MAGGGLGFDLQMPHAWVGKGALLKEHGELILLLVERVSLSPIATDSAVASRKRHPSDVRRARR